MSNSPKGSKYLARAMAGAVLLLCVAVIARLVYELLLPLLPLMGVFVVLAIVYGLLLGNRR